MALYSQQYNNISKNCKSCSIDLNGQPKLVCFVSNWNCLAEKENNKTISHLLVNAGGRVNLYRTPHFHSNNHTPILHTNEKFKKWRTLLRIREPTSTTSWNKTVFQISDDGRTAGTTTVPSITQQRRDSRFSHFVYYCPCFYTFIQKLLVNGLRSRYTFESHPVFPAESTHARPFCQPPVSPKREPDPKEKAAAAWPLVNLKEGRE